MTKRIRTPPITGYPDENLSRHLMQLQTHVQDLEKSGSAIMEEEGSGKAQGIVYFFLNPVINLINLWTLIFSSL